jgi:hypothetical protein
MQLIAPTQSTKLQSKRYWGIEDCQKVSSTHFNKNKHERMVHGGVDKKYMKDIKKETKYLCIRSARKNTSSLSP